MSNAELLRRLEEHDQLMRRNARAMLIRQYRYLTRTTPEQMEADRNEYNRRVLERGWIVGERSEGR